ncbi:PIG-L deacetylase family protein [Corynebacterium cystitidis]|uniref:PIG-L deacetylase family protein n=1 Tax=Corynebacterium cystitidis TaxID=35757 RepID=UPI00211DD3DA|nr:PIG-L deacetylase family protein [Corynebacterium cystitidis]
MATKIETENTDSTLTPLDTTGVERILCVGAHPDDLEYGISAAVAAWTAAGITVDYLLLTAGEAGMQRPPAEVGPLRAKEQQRACDIVGVTELRILDFPDGLMEYGIPVRKAIAEAIRELKPDWVVTSNFDLEAPWGINHVDHRVTGKATADAVRDAGNKWLFDDLGAPHAASKFLVGGVTDPTHYQDVAGEFFDKGVASLAAHKEYLADLPNHPSPQEVLGFATRPAGDSECAMCFKVWDM